MKMQDDDGYDSFVAKTEEDLLREHRDFYNTRTVATRNKQKQRAMAFLIDAKESLPTKMTKQYGVAPKKIEESKVPTPPQHSEVSSRWSHVHSKQIIPTALYAS